MTTRGLLAAVRRYTPAVEDEELVFGADVSADLGPVIEVLQPGIRAILTGRPWWGSSASGETRPRVAALDPDAPIPPWCGLLCVAGDTVWDRIGSGVRLDFPQLFTLTGTDGGRASDVLPDVHTGGNGRGESGADEEGCSPGPAGAGRRSPHD